MRKKIQEIKDWWDAREKKRHKSNLHDKLKELTNKKVESIYNKDPVTLREDQTLEEAALVMKTSNKGSIIVTKNSEPIGVVAESDFLKIPFEKKSLGMKVKHVMTEKIFSVSPRSTMKEAHDLMLSHGFRKLAVIENGSLVGIITQTDIVKQFDEFASHTVIEVNNLGTIRDVMTKEPLTIEKGKSAEDARELMRSTRKNSILVMENEKPIGIITTKDFVNQIILNIERLSKASVEMIMSGSLSSLSPDMNLFEANKLMLRPEYNFRRWPVMLEDKLLGIISQTDISRGMIAFVDSITESLEKGKVSDIRVTREQQ